MTGSNDKMPQEYNLTSQEVDTGSTTNPLYTSHDDKKSDVQVDGVQMENQSTKEDDTKTDDKNEKKKDEPVKMAGVGEVVCIQSNAINSI